MGDFVLFYEVKVGENFYALVEPDNRLEKFTKRDNDCVCLSNRSVCNRSFNENDLVEKEMSWEG